MAYQIIDCEQGTDEWLQARLGLPTASMFSAVMAKGEGKTKRAYMNKLAAEIITGEVGESFTSQAMERGKAMEDEARSYYAFLNNADPQRVGFVKGEIAGWSPDSLIGNDGALEIKTQRGDLLIETILANTFPSEHKAQCQGGLWVGEREWIDICVYWPRMPTFIKRAYRDEPYIKNLESEVRIFNEQLAELVALLRNIGAGEAS